MSIRIEVTGESLVEVSDKLLAIGNSLRNSASQSADDAAREAAQAERNSKPAPAKRAPPKAAPEKAPEPAPETVAEEKAPEAAPEPERGPEPAPAASGIDYDKDVAPLVPSAVMKSGRDAVIALLGEFGVSRAGEVPDALLGEFRDRLKALADG